MSAILRAEHLNVALGHTAIVTGANVALRRGEFVILVGPNGAGKTTIVRALAGLLPAQGKIELDGRALDSYSARERAQRIAYLPQGHMFHWAMPVETIVALGRYPYGDPFSAPTDADRSAVTAALAATATSALAQREITSLSGGERARVALARALATEAPVLLADEPTVSLDARHQLVVMELLRARAQAGGAVLAVAHDLSLAARFANRVLLMDAGRIVADGPASDALSAERIAATFGVEVTMAEVGGETIPIPRRPL